MRQDTLFMDSSVLLGELRLPELNLPDLQLPDRQLSDQRQATQRQATQRQTTQSTTTRRTPSRSTRSRSSTRSSTTQQTSPAPPPRNASQPVLDFRGSDYEGELPPVIPVEPDPVTEDPGNSPANTALDPSLEESGQPETPETVPVAPPRNTRSNPAIFEEEFILDLPDYNPLLD
jgi:hypothetical protein